MAQKEFFKVVTSELKSLGLRRNPNILEYEEKTWVRLPPEQIVEGKGPWSGWGGIGVVKTRGEATGLVRYMEKKHQVTCLVYRVDIGRILFEDKRRAKTDAVMLVERIS